MAVLLETEITEILKSQQHPEVQKAIFHEERLRLHSEPTLKSPEYNDAFLRFLKDYPDRLLPAEKRETFKHLLTFPLPTVELSDEAYKGLYKVFEGQDSAVNTFFKDQTLQQDFQEYRKSIGEPYWWKTKGFELMKTQINCLIQVDLPATPTGEVMPQVRHIPTSHIHQLKNRHDNLLDWVCYNYDKPKSAGGRSDYRVIVDDVAYRIYKHSQGGSWVLELESFHNLGFCPVRFFWTDAMPSYSDHDMFLKRSPVTEALGRLDWYLWSEVTGRHLDLYAGYPIYTIYEQDCTYTTEDGVQCSNGQLNWYYHSGDKQGQISKSEPCPNCATNKNLIGPGTILNTPAKREQGDPDMMPGLQVTAGQTDSIKLVEEKLDNLRHEFLMAVVGGDPQASKEAINEKQVMSQVESRLTVLMNLKKNYEKIQAWTLDTMGKLRYGDQYLGSQVNYGTKFHLTSYMYLQEEYKTSQETGTPNFALAMAREDMALAKNGTDISSMTKVELLSQLEPLQDYTTKDIMDMLGQGLVSRPEVILKIHFNDAVRHLESEVGDIAQYLSEVPPNLRIRQIRDDLQRVITDSLGISLTLSEVTPNGSENE